MFKIVLTNGVEDTELTFKVRKTPVAQKWFAELCKDYPVYEDDRFSNWNDQSNLVEELNKQIDIINSYDNIIDRKISNSITQQDLNYLHKFFEDLRGEVVVGTEWYHKSPEHVRIALSQYNVLIHKLEEYLRSKNYPTLVITFKDRPWFELDKDDIKHFTFCWQKGTVYINYCHVGKPILDVFKDHDKIAEGVRPQTHYSADFMIKFGPPTNSLVYLLRKLIIQIWLRFQKFKFENTNIGYIPVADIVGNFDINNYRKFNKVKSVKCIK